MYTARRLVRVLLLISTTTRGNAMYETQGPNFSVEPLGKVIITNTQGGRVDCAARGNPEPRVQWIGSDTSPVRDIPSIRTVLSNGSLYFAPFKADAFRQDVHWAIYRCVIMNSVGTIVSRDVVVKAVVDQKYEPEIKHSIAYPGNNMMLRCVVPAFVKDYVTVSSWLQEPSYNIYPSTVGDGKYHMFPSGTGELVIMNVTKADTERQYRCRTHHTLTQEALISSKPSQLRITEPRSPEKPEFSDKLVTLMARAEDTVIIPCVAHGNPTPSYMWFHSTSAHESSAIEDGERYWIRDGSLIIISVKEVDGGTYYCNASNSEGYEMMEVQLHVTAPLSVRIHPARQTVDVGKSAELNCLISGFPHNTIYWLKDGHALRTNNRIKLASKDKLVIASMNKEDKGMYQCFVKNEIEMVQGASEIRLGDAAPQLLYKFIEQTIQPGPSVSLKCSATGNPTPQITWLLDGFSIVHNERLMIGQYVTIYGDVISHVNITQVKSTDGGEYECVAENRAGKVGHSARLNIYGLPFIRPIPNISAIEGKELDLKCPVAGYPIESILWEKDNARLPSNARQKVTNGGWILKIQQVQKSVDQGSYSCTAKNKHNHTSHRSFQIQVLVPPKITPFSFARDLNVGDRTSIQCVVVTGDLPLRFSWSFQGAHITHSDSVTVRQFDDFNSALSIASVDPSHAGNYTCQVENDAATVTHTATLQVNVPPRISPFYFEDGVKEGMRTQVMCSSSQGDQPFNFTWYKDGKVIDKEGDWISIIDYAAFSSILTINSVTPSHTGDYKCVIANSAGTAQHTASLFVTVPPSWVVEPMDQNIILGNPATLQCEVDGFPKPNIVWKQAVGGDKSGDYREIRSNTKGIENLGNGTLFIARATDDLEGHYLCQATNKIGPGLSKLIQLTVYVGPKFKTRSQQEIAWKGKVVHLRCEAEGDLPLDITWTTKGQPIDLSVLRYSVKNSQLEKGIMSELRIDQVSARDRGQFVCVAKNPYGQESAIIELLVQEPPGFPRNLQISKHTSRSLYLSWTSPLGADDFTAPVSTYTLQYKEARDVWHDHNPRKVIQGDQTHVLVAGLKPATHYHFRLYAENQLGISPPSDVLQGITEPEIPAGSPIHVNVEAVSSTQLRVTWQPPDRELWNGELTGYNVGYKRASAGDSESYVWNHVATSGETHCEFRLTALGKFVEYSVVVAAVNSKGAGPNSERVVAQTLEDAPDAPPENIMCRPLNADKLQVTWQPPPPGHVNGIILGYKLFYELADEMIEHKMQERKVKDTRVTLLDHLKPYTNYSLQIMAFTRAGEGVISPEYYCHTDESLPDAPERVKTTVSADDTVVVSWLPPKRPNGVITKYTVFIRILEQGQQVKIVKGSLPPQVWYYEAEGLKQREKYEAWVAAFTRIGQGQTTPVLKLSVSTVIPAAVISFGYTVVTPWKSDVKLHCMAAGRPSPTVEWKVGDMKINKFPRMQITPDNTLTIQNVQRSNEGNYSCTVTNHLGSDVIIYPVHVQVPPTSPLLLTTSTTTSSIQLQWKQGDNGGAVVKGFLLSYRMEKGKWKEISIDRRMSTYLLENLECGKQYEFRLSAYNKIGVGALSNVEVARTKGNKPSPSVLEKSVDVNTTSITLDLTQWSDGGCPISHFVVEYKNSDIWELASNNIMPKTKFSIVELQPSTKYTVKITGHNSAGKSSSEYAVTTLPVLHSGNHVVHQTPNQEATNDLPIYLNAQIIATCVVIFFLVIILIGAMCLCLCGKGTFVRHTRNQAPQTEPQAALVEPNVDQREADQYYAKPDDSPSGEAASASVDHVPEYAEDIYPYATFHLPELNHVRPRINPLRRPAYAYSNSSTDSINMSRIDADKYPKVQRGRKSRMVKSESEEYDSDSETEVGTSSRATPLSHLDVGMRLKGPYDNLMFHTPGSNMLDVLSPTSEYKHEMFQHNDMMGWFVKLREDQYQTDLDQKNEHTEPVVILHAHHNKSLQNIYNPNIDFTIAV